MSYYIFPALQMPDDRYCHVEISTQEFWYNESTGLWVVGDITDTFDIGAVTAELDSNPILAETLRIGVSGAKDIGQMGFKDAEFEYSNIAVEGTDTLNDILRSVDLNKYVWHIRIGFNNSPSVIPQAFFWGVLELSDPEGERSPLDEPDAWDQSVTAVDYLTMLGRVEIGKTHRVGSTTTFPWLETYMKHSDLDTPASGIDATVKFTDYVSGASAVTGTPAATHEVTKIVVWKRDDGWIEAFNPAHTRFFNLKQMVHQIGKSAGITHDINDGNDVDCTTRWIIATGGAGTEVEKKWDELYIISSIYHAYTTHIQTDSFFEQALEDNDVSILNLGTALDLIKYLLLPFGLTAELRITAANVPYIHIREFRTSATHDKTQLILKGVQVESGEKAIFGLEVAVANDETFRFGSSNDRNIDVPFMGTLRLTYDIANWGAWSQTTHYVQDTQCYMQGVYALHGTNTFYGVGKVKIKSAGSGERTLWESMLFNGSAGATGYNTRGLGLFHAAACGFMHYNQELDTVATTGPVGEFGRISQALSFKTGEIDETVYAGDAITSIPNHSGDWPITEYDLWPFSNETEFKVERRAVA